MRRNDVSISYNPTVQIYTWSYVNRVSNHFVIFLNFPCLTACLPCCLLMSCFFVVVVVVVLFLLVFWLGICVEVDVDRITIVPWKGDSQLRKIGSRSSFNGL